MRSLALVTAAALSSQSCHAGVTSWMCKPGNIVRYTSYTTDQSFERLIFVNSSEHRCRTLASSATCFAHEAPVYIPGDEKVLVASCLIGTAPNYHVKLSLVDLTTGEVQLLPQAIWASQLINSNGACLDTRPGSDGRSVFVAAQGDYSARSGIYKLNLDTMMVDTAAAVEAVITSVSASGTQFNSLNDVILDPLDGSLWLTDPHFGYTQKFRPKPNSSNALWRYPRPSTPEVPQDLRKMAGFTRPNGLAFTDAGRTLLVADTGVGRIYAFDVLRSDSGTVSLVNKRTFASGGSPDGIKVDCQGFVYSASGNGIYVYDRAGFHVGRITHEARCNNLELIRREGGTTDLVALCNKQVFVVPLDTSACDAGVVVVGGAAPSSGMGSSVGAGLSGDAVLEFEADSTPEGDRNFDEGGLSPAPGASNKKKSSGVSSQEAKQATRELLKKEEGWSRLFAVPPPAVVRGGLPVALAACLLLGLAVWTAVGRRRGRHVHTAVEGHLDAPHDLCLNEAVLLEGEVGGSAEREV